MKTSPRRIRVGSNVSTRSTTTLVELPDLSPDTWKAIARDLRSSAERAGIIRLPIVSIWDVRSDTLLGTSSWAESPPATLPEDEGCSRCGEPEAGGPCEKCGLCSLCDCPCGTFDDSAEWDERMRDYTESDRDAAASERLENLNNER